MHSIYPTGEVNILISKLAGLQDRFRQSEVMDDPGLGADRFIGSLVGLRRINTITGSARIIWPALRRHLSPTDDKPIRVLDVASGAGDTAIALWKHARVANRPLEISGCDINSHAVEFAQDAAQRASAQVQFFQHDILNDPFPKDYDFVISSLFLHHLNEQNAKTFLSAAAAHARQGILIHDLNRGKAGYLFAYYGVRLISRSDVVHVDGPRSVEGAFTPEEARALGEAAGLLGCQVTTRWPFRYLLEWSRP
jgi:SAM-dependent methyltransferase